MLSVIYAAPSIHHEAIDWARRASANGGVISTTVLRAVSDFCAAADREAFRSAIYRFNPFAGGNLSGALVPLYLGPTFGGTTYGNATDTNVNFVSGDFAETGASGGLKGNGTNKHLDTGLTLGNIDSVLNVHMSASATSLETGISTSRATLVGVFTNAATNASIIWGRDSSGTGRGGYAGNFTGIYGTSTTTESHIIFSRSSAALATLYQGGASVASSTQSAAAAAGTASFCVFALGGALPNTYTAARMRMYSIGASLNSTQASAFSAAVAALNTALGR